MTIYRANANELTKDQLISIINKQTEAMLEIESEITTLKQRESKLVEALRLLEQVSTAPKNGKISLELYREKAREVLKELGGEG